MNYQREMEENAATYWLQTIDNEHFAKLIVRHFPFVITKKAERNLLFRSAFLMKILRGLIFQKNLRHTQAALFFLLFKCEKNKPSRDQNRNHEVNFYQICHPIADKLTGFEPIAHLIN